MRRGVRRGYATCYASGGPKKKVSSQSKPEVGPPGVGAKALMSGQRESPGHRCGEARACSTTCRATHCDASIAATACT